MFTLFNKICCFIGYKLNIDFNNYNLKIEKKNSNNQICNNKTIKIYHAFIGIILIINPCYFIYKIILDFRDLSNYANLFFMLIGFSNFIIGIKYFKKKYFFNIIKDILIYKSHIGKMEILYEDKTLSIITLLSSFLLLIINIIFSILDYNSYGIVYDFRNYTEYKYSILIYSVINDLYTNIILCINLLIFIIVFFTHYNELNNEYNKLNDKINSNEDNIKNYSIECSSICYDVLWIRNQLENSIEKLQSLYLCNTLFGSIAIGFIIELGEITPFFALSGIYWFVCQILYFFVIYKIENKKSDLIKIIKKPKFYIRYLKKRYNNSDDFFKNFIKNFKKNRKGDYLIEACSTSNQENESTIQKTSYIIEMEEKEPMEIDLLLHNISDINENNEKEDINNIVNNKILQNNSSLDWIILNTILTEEWDCFEFLGFQFNNSNSIQNSIAIVAILIFITEWFISINLVN